jgi:hypothetical protein
VRGRARDGQDSHDIFACPRLFFTTQHNTGPLAFQELVGQCFAANTDDNKYEYRFCPFDNVTQHDIQASWNAYNGVLGIWHTWEVVEGTMAQLKFKEGDSCGGKQRQVTVNLVCGKANLASNPSEPNPCDYALDFATPLACDDALSLAHVLKPESAAQLLLLDEELYDEELTEAGHRKRVRSLLKENKLLPVRPAETTLPPPPPPPPTTPAPPAPPVTWTAWRSDGDKLRDCDDREKRHKEMIEQLKAEVKALHFQIDPNWIAEPETAATYLGPPCEDANTQCT